MEKRFEAPAQKGVAQGNWAVACDGRDGVIM
jgi:hypothetical protein